MGVFKIIIYGENSNIVDIIYRVFFSWNFAIQKAREYAEKLGCENWDLVKIREVCYK